MAREQIHPDLKPLRDIQSIASTLRIPLLAVGANARLLVFDIPNRIEPHRTSTDWDVGVEVSQWELFSQLKEQAVESGLFSETSLEYRLLHKETSLPIDLIPFGGVELNGIIRWPTSRNEMTVLGFQEALQHCSAVTLGDGLRINVPTLPLLIVLKLFAFHDRGAYNNKDAKDLLHMIRNYPMHGREADRFAEPYVSVIREDTHDDEVAALFLGHDIARTCKPSTVEQIESIARRLVDPYSGEVDSIATRTFDEDTERRERERIGMIFAYLAKGLKM